MKRLLLLLCLCLLPVLVLADATPSDLATATDVATATDAASPTDLPMAEDITQQVLLNGSASGDHVDILRDGKYKTIWESKVKGGVSSLTITAPEGKTLGGVLINWRNAPEAIELEKPDGKGGWISMGVHDPRHFAQYYDLQGETEVRISHANPRTKHHSLLINDLRVITPGTPPDDFQIWQDPPEKVDMMLIHGHPDDEVLWFGGLLPYYAGELHKDVLVVCTTPHMNYRRHELLNSLWMCGVRNYPEIGTFPDVIGLRMNVVMEKWGKEKILAYITEQYRKYKPDVVVTHDFNGEYGHGVHKTVAWAATKSIPYANDPSKYSSSYKEYGLWEIPKVYVHLYEENMIEMDWTSPLDFFDGRTALEIAADAFQCHASQQNRGWFVRDHGEYDNALFGLYHTLVGPDVKGGDMFENLE